MGKKSSVYRKHNVFTAKFDCKVSNIYNTSKNFIVFLLDRLLDNTLRRKLFYHRFNQPERELSFSIKAIFIYY